ncbi:DUF2964 domain-containing protein [Paraburkholderia sp. RL17-383-BIF-A]|jgi:hypothetical protein|uniref:DUF2964 domain-containing protein n=3 Tax=Burkholderiales TaxID=80840 RepID=UPI0038BE1BC1
MTNHGSPLLCRFLAAARLRLMFVKPNQPAGPMMSSLLRLDSMEHIMIRSESRIIFAAIAVFVALAGIGASIRGLLFDQPPVFRYGVAALIVGVACFVMLLNSTADSDRQR